MQIQETKIDGVFVYNPRVFKDERGHFYESYNVKTFKELGITRPFVQDNQSRSRYGVLRGLHFQKGPYEQAKLVRVLKGHVLDVVVDIRPESKTFGEWISVELSFENGKHLYVPRGMAHGFIVLSEEAEFLYKCDNYYSPSSEGGIRYDDPSLNIPWPLKKEEIIVSDKDMELPFFERIHSRNPQDHIETEL